MQKIIIILETVKQEYAIHQFLVRFFQRRWKIASKLNLKKKPFLKNSIS